MRELDRIDVLIEKLRKYWKEKIPDWRFGQFMSNFLSWVYSHTKRDFFFIEEEEMCKLLDEYFEKL